MNMPSLFGLPYVVRVSDAKYQCILASGSWEEDFWRFIKIFLILLLIGPKRGQPLYLNKPESSSPKYIVRLTTRAWRIYYLVVVFLYNAQVSIAAWKQCTLGILWFLQQNEVREHFVFLTFTIWKTNSLWEFLSPSLWEPKESHTQNRTCLADENTKNR